MNFGMTITGAKEIDKKLHKLATKDVSTSARKSTRESQKAVMLPAVKSNAEGMVGGSMGTLIAKNLTVRAMTKMQRGSYGAKVVIKPTDAFVYFSADGTRSYIPNAIEYGHAAPGDAGGTKIVGPNPFQRKAYEQKRKPLAAHFSRMIVRLIEAAAKRGAK